MSTLQTADLKQVIRDYGAYIGGDATKAHVFAEEFRSFGPGLPPEGVSGLQAYDQMLQGFAKAFPDLTHSLDTVAVDGDVAMTEWTGAGTHRGEFAGIAPSGNEVTMRTAAAYVVKGGKIVEERAYFNLADLMAQLGVQ